MPPKKSEDDSEDESLTPAEHVRRSIQCTVQPGSDDEDSDFD